jgi:hypothetical protein
MALPAIAAGAIRIGTMFARGTGSLLSAGARGVGRGGGMLRKATLRRTKIRRENFIRTKKLNKRIIETRKRRQKESMLEASKLGRVSGGIGKLPGSNFFEKVLKFIGILIIGWLINNLPKIIKFVENLIKRIQKLVNSLKSFVKNLGDWFKSIGSIVSAGWNNIRNFDFTDSQGKLKNAMTDMEKAFKGMQTDIEGMKNALTGDMSGESSGGSTAGGDMNAADIIADTPEEKAFIATVRELEGTSGLQGYNTWFGGRTDMDLSQMTVNEVVAEQKRRLSAGEATYGRYTSAAVGAGQFMKPEQTVMAMGLDPGKVKYTPELQNKMILFQSQWARGVNPSKRLNENDMRILGGEWASFTPQYGQTSRTASQSLSVYQKNLREAGGGGSGGRYGSGGNVVEYITGDRNHPNYDYNGHGRESNYHDHIAFRNIQDKNRAKAALRAAGIRIGSEYRPGDPGWHGADLAIDIPGAQWGGSGAIGQREFNGSAKVRQVLKNAGFGGAGLGHGTSSIARSTGIMPDIGYSTGPQNTMIIIEEEGPPPMMMQQSGGSSPVIVMGSSLNSITKRKLLTDLAYT